MTMRPTMTLYGRENERHTYFQRALEKRTPDALEWLVTCMDAELKLDRTLDAWEFPELKFPNGPLWYAPFMSISTQVRDYISQHVPTRGKSAEERNGLWIKLLEDITEAARLYRDNASLKSHRKEFALITNVIKYIGRGTPLPYSSNLFQEVFT